MPIVPVAAIRRTTLAADYRPGDGQFAVEQGSGAVVAPAPTPESPQPLILDVIHCANVRSVYQCTGREGDVLTGLLVLDGTLDQFFAAGSHCWAGAFADGGGGNYAAPAFTAFGIAGISGPAEVGFAIPEDTYTFTWATVNGGNIQADSIAILDTTAGTTLDSGLADTGSDAIDLAGISDDGPATQVWTIRGTSTEGSLFSRAFTLQWDWRVYAGTSSNVTLTANQIKALDDSSGLQAGFAGTYAYNASNIGYKYFCYPDELGDAFGFIDANTGQMVSMADSADNAAYSNVANGWNYALVSVINANSATCNYRVYRTANSFSGNFSTRVS